MTEYKAQDHSSRHSIRPDLFMVSTRRHFLNSVLVNGIGDLQDVLQLEGTQRSSALKPSFSNDQDVLGERMSS